MRTNYIPSSELATPLSFSFTNLNNTTHNNLKNQNVTKTTFSHLNIEQDIDKVLQSMRKQCDEEYIKLNDIRSKIKYFETPKNLSEKAKRIALLKAEEQRLDEEIEEQKKDQRTITTKPHVLCELSVMKHIQETIETYKNILLPQLHQEINEAKDQISREKELLNESEIIHNVLLDKLEKLQRGEPKSQESELSTIKEEINIVKNNFDMLMDELTNFVTTNFPLPQNFEKVVMVDSKNDTENEIENETDDKTGDKSMLSLKDMLEDLMNRTYYNPNNPYITFDPDKIWPPYVETLIRAGIAKRHPNDANRFKLVEFHL
ncbi:centromere protein Cenp-K [Glomus cerebriforme]|uniref:Centromere protein Cenp-K n=1 Tax=Glomus cerebriforme TaxID=658196 RepID=A0A397T0D0_9GLOM|nr:centromere protein Cenp-K [Glomus cerebriforme]